MKVKLIRATEKPEELVCTSARNDYRSDGIIGYSFEEIIESVEPKEEHLMDSINPIEERKRTLLDHLMDSGHWGPFEHPQATIAIEGVTRVVTHQIVRHRHFTFDQQSFRYVEVDDIDPKKPPQDRGDIKRTFQFPEFRGEDFDVDREGIHEIASEEAANTQYSSAYIRAVDHYENLVGIGVPKEQARKVLPMGIKTNIVMSGNARAWMHILNVRTKADVQGETRRCAELIFQELKTWMPYTFEKYDEDILPLRLNP